VAWRPVRPSAGSLRSSTAPSLPRLGHARHLRKPTGSGVSSSHRVSHASDQIAVVLA
jgi:hypothetical protein